MSDPVPLRIVDAEPEGSGIVFVLELALEMARNGGLSSICIAGIVRDGAPYWNWSDAPNTSALIGAIERMKADLIRTTDE